MGSPSLPKTPVPPISELCLFAHIFQANAIIREKLCENLNFSWSVLDKIKLRVQKREKSYIFGKNSPEAKPKCPTALPYGLLLLLSAPKTSDNEWSANLEKEKRKL